MSYILFMITSFSFFKTWIVLFTPMLIWTPSLFKFLVSKPFNSLAIWTNMGINYISLEQKSTDISMTTLWKAIFQTKLIDKNPSFKFLGVVCIVENELKGPYFGLKWSNRPKIVLSLC